MKYNCGCPSWEVAALQYCNHLDVRTVLVDVLEAFSLCSLESDVGLMRCLFAGPQTNFWYLCSFVL